MNLEEQLVSEEGEVLHAYKDHLGFLTIGVGILIDERKGGGITPGESRYLLRNRIDLKRREVEKALPWLSKLNEPRQAVLLGMAFQMGTQGLLGFKNTLGNVEAGSYEAAANGMMNSLWAKQTPARAARMAKQMKLGVWVLKE